MKKMLGVVWQWMRSRSRIAQRAHFGILRWATRRRSAPSDALSRVLEEFGRAYPNARFVQVGANDGVTLDPLHRQILIRDWTGVLLEPVPSVFKKLAFNLDGCVRATLENAAIADQEGVLPFYRIREMPDSQLPSWLSLLGSFRREVIASHSRYFPDIERYIDVEQVRALTWDSLCRRHGLTDVDLIQVDAEGYDYELLRRLPFERLKPLLLMYEHRHLTHEDRQACASLLQAQGYDLVEQRYDTLALRVSALDARHEALLAAWRYAGQEASIGKPTYRSKLRFSVIVTCYNYEEFILQAVESALQQRLPAAQVIVVDDGSTDRSSDLLRHHYGNHPNVQLVFKANGGQLSAFARGLAEATGDVVCFLDADDFWTDDYLARIATIYEAQARIDFVFTNLLLLAQPERRWHREEEDHDFGITILETYFARCWQGSPTSALSMRRHVANNIVTRLTDFHADWRTRADDCLVYGAGILGARKYYCADPLVRYRIHQNNNWFGTPAGHAETYLYQWRLERLLNHFAKPMGLSEEHLELAKAEFRTKPNPTIAERSRYQTFIKRSGLSWRQRLEHSVAIWSHQRHPDRFAQRFQQARYGRD